MNSIAKNLHLLLKSYKTISKQSHSIRTFQQYQELVPICLKYSLLILLNFLWWSCSTFNNSCNIGLNTTKWPQCTPIHIHRQTKHQQQGKQIVWNTTFYKSIHNTDQQMACVSYIPHLQFLQQLLLNQIAISFNILILCKRVVSSVDQLCLFQRQN